MSELIARIKELEDKERQLEMIVAKVGELNNFIINWDSEDPVQIPQDHKAKINPVRNLVAFCTADA